MTKETGTHVWSSVVALQVRTMKGFETHYGLINQVSSEVYSITIRSVNYVYF
jgi:hypothetical protein